MPLRLSSAFPAIVHHDFGVLYIFGSLFLVWYLIAGLLHPRVPMFARGIVLGGAIGILLLAMFRYLLLSIAPLHD